MTQPEPAAATSRHAKPHIVNGECQCNCAACGDDHCICPDCQHPGMRPAWMTK